MRHGQVIALALLCALAGCKNVPLTTEGRAGCEPAVASVSGGSPTMLPGAACMTCHDQFTAAGTVFTSPTSACDVGHAPDVRVEILDGTGRAAITMTTNSVGNFYTGEPLPSPYTVRITAPDGTTQSMITPQTIGSCAHCHRLPPANAAPGRIATMTAAAPDAGVADAQ